MKSRKGSTVTGGASFLGMNHELLLQLEAKLFSGFHAELGIVRNVGLCVVAEVVDLLERTEVFLGSAVAIEAPAHREWADLVNDLHLVHVAVAALAGNPAIDVGGVVEIDVVRCFVNLHPLDRLAIVSRIRGIHRLVERSQFRAVALDVLVAVPAGAPGRDVGNAGNVDE